MPASTEDAILAAHDAFAPSQKIPETVAREFTKVWSISFSCYLLLFNCIYIIYAAGNSICQQISLYGSTKHASFTIQSDNLLQQNILLITATYQMLDIVTLWDLKTYNKNKARALPWR